MYGSEKKYISPASVIKIQPGLALSLCIINILNAAFILAGTFVETVKKIQHKIKWHKPANCYFIPFYFCTVFRGLGFKLKHIEIQHIESDRTKIPTHKFWRTSVFQQPLQALCRFCSA